MTTATGSGRSRQQSSRSSQSGKQSGSQSKQNKQNQQQETAQRQGTARQQGTTQRQESTRQRTAERTTSAERADGGQSGATTVDLPFVTAQFRVPEMRLPSGEDFNSAANSVRSQLPSREDSMFYGGLAAGAAFALIDWPVALAIGVGHAMLSRGTRPQESGSPSSGKESTA